MPVLILDRWSACAGWNRLPDSVRVIQAGTSTLPGQARGGVTPVPDAWLARPFNVFVANRGGR